MREYNEYVARVAQREQRSKTARNEGEKQRWLAMADSWRETAKLQRNFAAAGAVYRAARCSNPWLTGLIMLLDTISHGSACDMPLRGAHAVCANSA
jgi:hypothetical protein